MSASNRGFRGKSTNMNARTAQLPDNFGNRRTFDEVRIPPDNIGNNVEQDLISDFVHDSVGNCLEDEPSHYKSGILARLAVSDQKKAENRRRRPERPVAHHNEPVPSKPSAKMLTKNAEALPRLHSTDPDFAGDDYIAKLNADFAKLLGQKSGQAFSFSMKPIADEAASHGEASRQELPKVKKLIAQILEANTIKAQVFLTEYRSPVHHFAVFFIEPEEEDPLRSKEMIAALRQVVNEYMQKMVKSSVNVFLVLANARPVIEEHLLKIGAKKAS